MSRTEVWLRNETIEGLSPILQPAANALLEAKEEIQIMLQDFPEDRLWDKPYNSASVGFHLKHIQGFLDRLLTYANGLSLNESQLAYLLQEELKDDIALSQHAENTFRKIDKTIELYKNFTDISLTATKYVGRAKITTTVIGLLFHSAEHTMRHVGQMLITTRILKA